MGELIGELLGEEVGAGDGDMGQNLAYSASSVVHWASSALQIWVPSAAVVGAADGTLVERAAAVGETMTTHASKAIAELQRHRGMQRSGKIRPPTMPHTHRSEKTGKRADAQHSWKYKVYWL